MKRINTAKIAWTAAGMLLAIVLGVRCANGGTITIYTNLDSSDGFNTAQGWVVDGGSVADQVIANAFTPSETITLADAQLALGSILGLSSMSVYLESNVSGAPGTVLASLTQQGTIGGFPGGLVDYTCAACPVLQAGTEYWLVAQESDPDTVVAWGWNDIGDISTGNFVYNDAGSISGPWQVDLGDSRGAFEVQGTATPEPATLFLLGTALIAVSLLRGRLGRALVSNPTRETPGQK